MEIKLPNLKKVLGGSKSFVINGNNGNFANSSKFCCEIENGLYKASSDVPLIDRQTCEAIQEKKQLKCSDIPGFQKLKLLEKVNSAIQRILKIQNIDTVLKLQKSQILNFQNFNSSDPSKRKVYIQYDYFGIKSQNYVCFSLEETSNFYGAENVVMSNQDQTYCNHSSATVFGERLCKVSESENIKNLEENCQRIFGILEIGPGDEAFVYKLENVTWIYGQLIIENTNLTSINFLNNLGFVISFDNYWKKSSLQILQNKNLMEIQLPSLKRALGGYSPFVITGNNGNFANNSKFCCEIRHGLHKTSKDVPLIDRQICGNF
ncbi:hypothetical protein B9Z55_018389 [Caenorhabditis nigoni]|nr:hypothetical protein B9Z55_018389 [Caenorhabditis nigoni]